MGEFQLDGIAGCCPEMEMGNTCLAGSEQEDQGKGNKSSIYFIYTNAGSYAFQPK